MLLKRALNKTDDLKQRWALFGAGCYLGLTNNIAHNLDLK